MMPSAVWGAPCAGTGHVRALWRCLHAHHRGLKRRRRKHEIPSPIKTVVVVVMENHRKPVRAWDMSAHAYVDAVDLRRCRANSIVGQVRQSSNRTNTSTNDEREIVSARSHRGKKIDPRSYDQLEQQALLACWLGSSATLPRYCSVPEQQAPHATTRTCWLLLVLRYLFTVIERESRI